MQAAVLTHRAIKTRQSVQYKPHSIHIVNMVSVNQQETAGLSDELLGKLDNTMSQLVLVS